MSFFVRLCYLVLGGMAAYSSFAATAHPVVLLNYNISGYLQVDHSQAAYQQVFEAATGPGAGLDFVATTEMLPSIIPSFLEALDVVHAARGVTARFDQIGRIRGGLAEQSPDEMVAIFYDASKWALISYNSLTNNPVLANSCNGYTLTLNGATHAPCQLAQPTFDPDVDAEFHYTFPINYLERDQPENYFPGDLKPPYGPWNRIATFGVFARKTADGTVTEDRLIVVAAHLPKGTQENVAYKEVAFEAIYDNVIKPLQARHVTDNIVFLGDLNYKPARDADFFDLLVHISAKSRFIGGPPVCGVDDDVLWTVASPALTDARCEILGADRSFSTTDHNITRAEFQMPISTDTVDTPTLCDVNDCTVIDLWLDGQSQDYLAYFTPITGYHVGTQEHQKYIDTQVGLVLGAPGDEGYVSLRADEADEFDCIGNGYVNRNDRSEVYLGTCRYESGAVSTLNNGFFVNRDSGGNPINSGGIEVRLRMKKNDSSISFDELFKLGAWPAAWLMSTAIDDTFRIDGENFVPRGLWPEAMELDIVEFINGGWTDTTPVIGSIHYGYLANENQTSWNYVNNIGDFDRPVSASAYPRADPENWHNYGFTWSKKDLRNLSQGTRTYTLSWYFDGEQYQTLSITRTVKEGPAASITYTAERSVGGQTTEIWCTSSSARCCTVESARCDLDVTAELPATEAEVMFKSLEIGLEQGYYLNLNLAAGGSGIGVYDPDLGGFPPPAFGSAEMQISRVSRYSFDTAEVDTDGDGVGDNADQCASTPAGEVSTVNASGCGSSERDVDGDGVNDNLDAFPNDRNETQDTDGDGYGDNEEIADGSDPNNADDVPIRSGLPIWLLHEATNS